MNGLLFEMASQIQIRKDLGELKILSVRKDVTTDDIDDDFKFVYNKRMKTMPHQSPEVNKKRPLFKIGVTKTKPPAKASRKKQSIPATTTAPVTSDDDAESDDDFVVDRKINVKSKPSVPKHGELTSKAKMCGSQSRSTKSLECHDCKPMQTFTNAQNLRNHQLTNHRSSYFRKFKISSVSNVIFERVVKEFLDKDCKSNIFVIKKKNHEPGFRCCLCQKEKVVFTSNQKAKFHLIIDHRKELGEDIMQMQKQQQSSVTDGDV